MDPGTSAAVGRRPAHAARRRVDGREQAGEPSGPVCVDRSVTNQVRRASDLPQTMEKRGSNAIRPVRIVTPGGPPGRNGSILGSLAPFWSGCDGTRRQRGGVAVGGGHGGGMGPSSPAFFDPRPQGCGSP